MKQCDAPSQRFLNTFHILFTTSVGQPIVLYVSALSNVDHSLIEAAQVDGATNFRLFWRIKWPQIMPTTLYILLITTINSFQCFAPIQLLTSGGPINSTSTVMYYIYYEAFKLNRYGYGSAMGVILAGILEAVMAEVRGECAVIAHVACNNTDESCRLAAHAQGLGVDAIASIPPIYFRLPDHAIAAYWNAISATAPDTDFILYNIPQLAGVALGLDLYREMRKNPRVIGVKNSSMAAQDIQMFKHEGGDESIVFNGPDEQYVAGRAIGADGGIGGTYGVMPELFLKMDKLTRAGDYVKAQPIQNAVNDIIANMCGCKGNLYAVMKKIIELREGLSLGSVRAKYPEMVIMADCATVQEAVAAHAAGADLAGTTMNGYTPQTANHGDGPNLELVRQMAKAVPCPVIAEGRIHTPEQAKEMLACGAWAVVVGGAITRPLEIAQRFIKAVALP